MQRFSKIGQRVKVIHDHNGHALGAVGTVTRIRTDGGAFVALDQRSKVEAAHPFPINDDRATHVRAYPDDCEPATGNAKERHVAKRVADCEWPPRTIDTFGKDHWSTFAYADSVCAGQDGIPNRDRMRCNHHRHLHLAGPITLQSATLGVFDVKGRYRYHTRTRNGELREHDDWDCIDDLVDAGLMCNTGTTINPCWLITEAGLRVVAKLRAHKQAGGTFSSFTVTTETGATP